MNETKKNITTETEEDLQTGFWYKLADYATTLVIVAIFVVLIRTFIFSPFHVSGPSMCNTINYIDDTCQAGYGEYIIVNKVEYGLSTPERGEIVVFKPDYTDAPYLIKRVIGIPGDVVVIRDGDVFLQTPDDAVEQKLDETYLSLLNQGATTVLSSREEHRFEVPDGKYFVMGDNRKHSTDSRTCFGRSSSSCAADATITFVPEGNISGRAWLTLWPLAKVRFLTDL